MADKGTAAIRAAVEGLDWLGLLSRSQHRTKWHKKEWWHNKYYKRQTREEDNDGSKPQVGKRGETEIPHERKIFYPSNTRFGLGDIPVAYFSNDFAVNCCETIEQFRDDPNLSFEELSTYLKGEHDPTPDLYGYALAFRIDDTAILLDILGDEIPQPNDPLSIVNYRSDEAYAASQILAQRASQEGVDGIVYRSARVPDRFGPGVVLPSANLVMFREDLVYQPDYGDPDDTP